MQEREGSGVDCVVVACSAPAALMRLGVSEGEEHDALAFLKEPKPLPLDSRAST